MGFRSSGNDEMKKGTKRIHSLGLLFFVGILVVLYRTFSFQVIQREKWDMYSKNQYETRVKLIAKRGVIYDRDMNILAADKPSFSIAVDPTQVQDKEKAAKILNRVLGGGEEKYTELFQREGSFVWVEKDITAAQKHALEESQIYGLIPVEGQMRGHPYGDLARQVIGITNSDHQGVWGVEQELDPRLRGENGWAIYQKDGLNRNFSSLDYPVEPPKNGHHAVLAIDHVFQHVVEEELQHGVEKYKAKSGSAVLMDPYTGDVLSMASYLGTRGSSSRTTFSDIMQNRAVQVDFEPGSTFKIVTASVALEEGDFKPNTLIHCENGSYTVGSNTIRDDDRKFAWLTMSQVIEESSNIGAAKMAKKIGKKEFSRYIQNFGFGNATGIQLPGEPPGIVRPYYQWGDFSTAAVAFGQGISVTSIQLACMVSVIANGGYLVQPRLISKIVDNNGFEVETYPATLIRRVIKEETAQQIQLMLKGVVERGSGREAAVTGVPVAGKTGTAQKSKPGFRGYVPGAYTSSFIGFWPAHSPAFVLVVVLDEPQYLYWGSKSAAPTFGRIVEKISGLPKTQWSMQEIQSRKKDGAFMYSSYEEEKNELPPLAIEMSEKEKVEKSEGVPNLVGYTLRDALKRLAEIDMEAKITGYGKVKSQTPAPGSPVAEGVQCHLICEFSD